MSIAVSKQEERGPVITPNGRWVDQAALLGVLNGLHSSLHLLLLSVERLSLEAMESPSIDAMDGQAIGASDANPDKGTSALYPDLGSNKPPCEKRAEPLQVDRSVEGLTAGPQEGGGP